MDSKENYINQTDFARILAAIPSLKIRKWNDNDVVMLFKILYWLGLRPMEGIPLKKEDFHLNDNLVRLGKTKTEKLTYNEIPPPFRAELHAYINSKPDGPLFPGLTYITVYKWIRRLGDSLNIIAWTSLQEDTGEKTKGHIFRKSLGKDLLYGVHGKEMSNIVDIATLLRHDDPVTTIKYYLKEDQRAVMKKWQRVFNPNE